MPVSRESAAVLAFGKLSALEICSKAGMALSRVEVPCERVAVLDMDPAGASAVQDLAGIHKWGPMLATVDAESGGLGSVADLLRAHVDSVGNLSVSGYEIDEGQYESVVRALLDALKDDGFLKVRLLRPAGNELLANDVLSRQAFDFLAFPFHEEIGLALTAWVPGSSEMIERGTQRPASGPPISMSPRLARLLVNLAGVRPGKTLLDPFCGSGTILAEGLLCSYRCVGVDSSPARVADTKRNLSWTLGGLGNSRFQVMQGDARRLTRLLDRSKVDAVVTEPFLLPAFRSRPRTRDAEELFAGVQEVYSEALVSMSEVLGPGGRIVMVVPVVTTAEGEEVSLLLNARRLGLKLYQPGPVGFEYPIRPSFQSTRWVKRAVYVFESRS